MWRKTGVAKVNTNPEQTLLVREAIEERIEALREELDHWQGELKKLEIGTSVVNPLGKDK